MVHKKQPNITLGKKGLTLKTFLSSTQNHKTVLKTYKIPRDLILPQKGSVQLKTNTLFGSLENHY